MPKHTVDYYMRRKAAMETERETFMNHWRELAEFVKPRRGRWFISDRNKGDRRYSSIINSRATQAHRIATAGMLAGTMSPSRPWFELETNDRDLNEVADVKDWLWRGGQKLRDIFNAGNLYGQASNLLSETLLFGTAAMLHVDDYDDVARFYTQTAGSYFISQNDRYEVDTLLREFERPVRGVVGQFGLENCSQFVKDAYDKGNYDTWVPIMHIIQPNDDYDMNSPMSTKMAFESKYWEPGNAEKEKHKFLANRGFDDFPAYVLRWDTSLEDIYATDCPAMVALGDIKGLQIEEKRKAQGLDKLINPPLTGPPSVRNSPVNSLPGGLTIYDNQAGQQKLESLYNIQLPLQELRVDIDSVERRINEAFFVDLFLAISQMEGIQPRNQLDLMTRNEERLLQLGPILERLHSEFLSRLVERTFSQCVKHGILPDPPPELEGKEVKVKFISTMAMAQRAVATQSIERLAGFVGQVAQLKPEAVQKFDAEQAIDEYAKAIGAPPSVVVPDEVLAEQRQAQAEAADRQASLEQAGQMSNIAAQLGGIKTDEDNAAVEVGDALAGG